MSKRLYMHDPVNRCEDSNGCIKLKTKVPLSNYPTSNNVETSNVVTSDDVATWDLSNNLYVYNESSYPAKIRKKIRAQVTHSPEVVAVVLPSEKTSYERKAKSTRKVRALRVLLDSGGSDNLVRAAAVKSLKKLNSKFPVTWKTANGNFETDQMVNVKFQLPDFTEKVTINQPFHVCQHELDYDMIIGRKTLIDLGIIIDFLNRQIIWNDISVELKDPTLFDNRMNLYSLAVQAEPESCQDILNRAMHILDAGRDGETNLEKVVNGYKHLDQTKRDKLLALLNQYQELFDGQLGLWDTEPVSLEIKPGAKPYHGKAFPVPHIHKEKFKKEIDTLVELGVLEKDSSSQWAAPSFTQPKKNPNEVRFLSDFRQLNKCMVRKPYPLPKISEILQELTGLTYASALDLKMGYYTIRLNPDAQQLCTIITPWGKYKYMRLPMGISTAPDIFQNKMSDLMSGLEFVRVYLDDLLIITNGSFEDHLAKLQKHCISFRSQG